MPTSRSERGKNDFHKFKWKKKVKKTKTKKHKTKNKFSGKPKVCLLRMQTKFMYTSLEQLKNK